MKFVRLTLGVIAGLVLITLITESIEFITVKLASGASFEKLSSDQDYYFSVRNQLGILVFKVIYTGGSGFIAGYVASRISLSFAKICILLIVVVQIVSLIWAGFISELSTTGPMWMWIALMIVVPIGVYLGYKKSLSEF